MRDVRIGFGLLAAGIALLAYCGFASAAPYCPECVAHRQAMARQAAAPAQAPRTLPLPAGSVAIPQPMWSLAEVAPGVWAVTHPTTFVAPPIIRNRFGELLLTPRPTALRLIESRRRGGVFPSLGRGLFGGQSRPGVYVIGN